MPRTKQSQCSQAAKKRVADRMAADPAEALPPLKKLAELHEHCVYHKSESKSEKNPEQNLKEDTEITMNAVSNLFSKTLYIRGSFYQGDYRFGQNRGRQCGANSLTAILMCKMKSVLQWTRSDLNAVLIHGDELYNATRDAGKINDPTSAFI